MEINGVFPMHTNKFVSHNQTWLITGVFLLIIIKWVSEKVQGLGILGLHIVDPHISGHRSGNQH